ncbi:hypothetical protein CYMTET_31814 [Cymbomonas tetramitiformis]|uniref:Fe2OG dioxygenase domain-containing protein n=1 Tax=Cymbomonas tetramitiformis TaxID=36881 RepID=A0AAE0FGH7_9CHLO|nr:hypothetical protein CYMTET_31814 [Cymbomonas tetramitiformis]
MTLKQVLESERIFLSSSSWYIHAPRYFEIESSVFEELWDVRDSCEAQFYRMFGKRVRVPRRQGLFAEQSLTYKFSGLTIPSKPITMHPFMKTLLDSVTDTHNAVFVNWYENGKDYVSAHSDDERELVEGNCIISVSLNATRTFRIRSNKGGAYSFAGDKLDIELGDGDVFVMGGNFQKEFVHEVPKKPIMIGDPRRINFTLRGMVADRDACSVNKRKRSG